VGVVVSPELVLVDEELRLAACAQLPPVAPYAFVYRAPVPLQLANRSRRRTLRERTHSWRVRARPALHWLGVIAAGSIAGVLVGRILSHV
jgi:hypothetical protein